MRRLLFYLILISPSVTWGQQIKAPLTPAEVDRKWNEKHNQCFHSAKYSAKQRRAFFPFSKAATVKLVSFNDTVRLYRPIAPNNFAIDYSKAIETKTLSEAGIDSLTDILYNVGFTPVKHKVYEEHPEMMCYFPRNAILFLDSAGRVTQYIEICFECQHYYLSSRKIQFTAICDQKYGMLKTYFLSQGIKYVWDVQ